MNTLKLAPKTIIVIQATSRQESKNNLKLIKGDFVKVYSNNDIACAEFVRDIRLGRIMFDSIDTTNSILHSVCCD